MNKLSYYKVICVTALAATVVGDLWSNPTCSIPQQPPNCTWSSGSWPRDTMCCKDLSFGACRNVTKQYDYCSEGGHNWHYFQNDNALQPCDDDAKKCGSWP